MRKPELDPKIMKVLKLKTKGKIKTVQAIRNALSRIRRKMPFLTMNAAAEIFARKRGFSVSRYLKEADRQALKSIEIVKIPIYRITAGRGKRIIRIVNYETDDKLLRAHIEEINKTYTYGCYTATFVLCRKVLENLIIYRILRKKYPSNKREHREIYFDFNRGRFHDLEVLLKNLRERSKDFGPEKGLVERICQLAGIFKVTANEMTHSLYHIATKREIDESNFQQVLYLINKLEATI